MRRLKIDLSDLEVAFTMDQMSGIEHYLDLILQLVRMGAFALIGGAAN
ncbi:MAG: hypothetical protein ABFD83_06190 [Armatimonadota bacterium]